MITDITSRSNSIFKNTKKLLNASDRKKSRQFIVEGYRSVSDAIKHGADIEYIIISESYNLDTFQMCNRTYRLSDKLFSELSATVNSQGIIAVADFLKHSEIDFDKCSNFVYLDSVTDPGNMGTILRTCDAMGADGVILSKGCVDVYNPKVVRATMASLFCVPLYFDNDDTMVSMLKQKGFCIVGTVLDGSISSFESDLTPKTVIVMGNEANGISQKIKDMCDTKLRVPMSGGAESLNVAVCCSMLLYEKSRQTYFAEV